MAHKAIEVANALIALSDPEVGDIMSNLKLQKLLYYTQGFSLALRGQPIFDEDIVAWEYGPVVKSVYHEFKKAGSGAIEKNDDFDATLLFEKDEIDLIKEVYAVYGQFSALKLMNMTHEESPWKDTPPNGVISHSKLSSFFNTLVE